MIPYNTDAPLYHWPIATVVLMLLNSLLFFVVPSERLGSRAPDRQVVDPDQFNPLAPAEPEAKPDVDAQWDADAFHIVEQPQPPEPDRNVANRPVDDRMDQADRESVRGENAREERDAQGDTASLTLALEHGAGLKPWQWLTSMFLHSDIVQLVFNLIALWAFGLVVEGKVGAPVFLTIFLGIGVAEAGLEQALTLLSSTSVSMGANAALLGLLGVAVVWAPRNEFEVLWGFGMRVGSIEVPVLMFGFIQLAMELVGIATGSFGLSRSLMHMLGLVLGLAVGWVWLRRGWVDCEGWDLISVWNGTETGIPRDEQLEAEARQLVRASTHASQSKPATTSSKVLSQQRLLDIERLITDGNLLLALKLWAKLRVERPELQLSQPALYGLIRALLAAKDYASAIPFLREHIESFADQRITLQLNLAKLLLHLQQPRRAAEVLRGMKTAALDATARGTWQNLANHAQRQVDEGVIEIRE